MNSVTAGEQSYARTILLESGGFLVVWRSGWADQIAGRLFANDGTPVGEQFRISTYGVRPESELAAVGLRGGGFAVIWSGNAGDGRDDVDVLLQIFGPDGQRVGGEVLVNQSTRSTQYNPAATLLANGNVLVTWDQIDGPSTTISTLEVNGQIFSPDGARVGPEFVVNSFTNGYQQLSQVTALAGGGFVATWYDSSNPNPYGDTGHVAAQVFSDSGAKIGSDFRVNTVSVNDQRLPTVAPLSTGGFVIAWTDTSAAANAVPGYYGKFQLFNAAGAKVGGEVTVDTSGTVAEDVTVTELAGGGFIVSWIGVVWSGRFIVSTQAFAQVYDDNGNEVGDRLELTEASGNRWDLGIESLADGSFVATVKQRSESDQFDYDVVARIFTAVRSGETIHGTVSADTEAGGALDDFLAGYAGDDQLTGAAGADMLDGGAGNDRLEGGSEADRLDGGTGDDTLEGGSEADRLVGGAGNDLLDGGTGADRMFGGVGDDVYVADDAGDLVVEAAGGGNDEVQTALATYSMPLGVERLTGTSATGQSLSGGSGADTIIGGAGDDLLNGLGGDDLLDGGAGADSMAGGTGNDSYVVDGADSVTEAAGEGADEIRTAAGTYVLAIANVENLRGLSDSGQTLTGDSGGNRIQGAAGADLLDGAGGSDTLLGAAGADRLVGAEANDNLDGGADGDTLEGGEGNDVLDGGAGSDGLDGGNGDDVLKFAAAGGSGDVDIVAGGSGNDLLVVNFAAATASEGVRYSIVQDPDGSYSGSYWSRGERVEFTGIEAFQVVGSGFADQIAGGALSDFLVGGAGDDLVEGGDGNDLIAGGDGSDRLIGGLGNDRYVVSDGGDTIVEAEDGGIDQVDASVASYVLGPNLERLAGTAVGGQSLTGNELANHILALGSGSNVLSGAGGDDVLESGSWNDTLDGGTGADTMKGGHGADIYYVDDLGDNIIDIGGTDEIRTAFETFTLSLSSGVEYLTGLASTGQTLTGTSNGNRIQGGSGKDVLNGLAGNDELYGGADDDTLDGGEHGDYMFGGLGNDTYYVDSLGDLIVENNGEGTDRVFAATATFTLPTNVENLIGTLNTGQNLRGNVGSNTITGGAGNDILRVFDGGSDTLAGNDGDDILFFGGNLTSSDKADGGAGTDTLALQGIYSGLTFSAAMLAGIETVLLMNRSDTRYGLLLSAATSYTLTAPDAAVAAGITLAVDASELASNEALTFNGAAELDGRFSIIGGSAADSLTGGAGNDILDGRAGTDTLTGGKGNDLYFASASNEVIVEAEGEGTDEVRSQTASFMLPANVENLTGHLNNGQTLTGNGLVNAIVGGAGADVITGGGGDDRLTGNGGNDIYYVDSTGDIVVEWGDAGTDEVRTALGAGETQPLRIANQYQLPSYVEKLTGTGLNQGLRGNGLDNVITSGAGSDFINASDGGGDYVISGDGRDVIYYGGSLNWLDRNDAGSAGGDVRGDLLILQGDYSGGVTFNDGALVDIEKLRVLRGTQTDFGDTAGASYDYHLVTVELNLAPGARLVVQGGSLQVGETLRFNGSAESSGSFQVFGGRDNDVLTGGGGDDHLLGRSGNDTLTGNGGADRLRGGLGQDSLSGGAGADIFVYSAQGGAEGYTNAALESSSTNYDVIDGFTFGEDKIDLPVTVTGITSDMSGSLSEGSFDTDLAAALGTFQAGSAVLFTPDGGNLQARHFLVVDADGNGVYQANVDFVFELIYLRNHIPPADAGAVFV